MAKHLTNTMIDAQHIQRRVVSFVLTDIFPSNIFQNIILKNLCCFRLINSTMNGLIYHCLESRSKLLAIMAGTSTCL